MRQSSPCSITRGDAWLVPSFFYLSIRSLPSEHSRCIGGGNIRDAIQQIVGRLSLPGSRTRMTTNINTRFLQLALLTATYVLLAASCLAQTAPTDKQIVTKTDEYMNALARLHRFNGVILLARDG